MKKIVMVMSLVLAVNIYAQSKEGEVKETDPCKTNDSKRSQVKGKATKETNAPKGTKEQ
ncbi:MAG: hypothetical protein U0T83_00120 [Bacteriovoracaceae bacterium]